MSTDSNPAKSVELELVSGNAIESIERATIDVQIATAHRYPRSMQTFKQRAVEMATLDEETAASCIYSRPVGGGKFAEGLSVRTAEIVGACYGNLRVGAIIVEQTERFVKCRGMAHDLESNFASQCEVIEATIKRDGTPYDERMRVVIAKACLAKARRDATFQVVPKALCKPIETAARAVAIGDATTLTKRRTQVVEWIKKLSIEPARVFAALGVKGEDDIGLEELATLTGLKTAIKDGEVSVDEAFPKIIPPGSVGNPVDDATKKPESKKPEATSAATQKPATPAQKPEPTPEPAEEKKPAGDGAPTEDSLRAEIKSKLGKLGKSTKELGIVLVGLSIIKNAKVFSDLTFDELLAASDGWEQIEEALK